jgi:hypothetical protein
MRFLRRPGQITVLLAIGLRLLYSLLSKFLSVLLLFHLQIVQRRGQIGHILKSPDMNAFLFSVTTLSQEKSFGIRMGLLPLLITFSHGHALPKNPFAVCSIVSKSRI